MYKTAIFLLIFIVFGGSQLFAQQDAPARGKVIAQSNENGSYQVYIPKRNPERVLVVAHGTPNKGESTMDLANKFIQRWVKFANRHRVLLIAPSFDRDDYGSDPTTGFGYGGYRGLFGRKVGADEFVIGLVSEYSEFCTTRDGKFLLYGHSAGGQFLIRFCVKHPDKIAAAVASAPGRFAYPDSSAAWPYGMGTYDRKIRWSATELRQVSFEPKKESWDQAGDLPLSVVYGERDLNPQPKRAAHVGKTRIDYGSTWVEQMNRLNPVTESIKLILVKNIGHDSAKLTGECQNQFQKLKWIEPSPLERFRRWTSKGGNHQLEALYMGRDASMVKLKKMDGLILDVEIEKLSDIDAAILSEQPKKGKERHNE